MNKDSKIYVAGHTGLVGSSIVRRLKKNGYTNIVCKTRRDLNLTNQREVCNFFYYEKPEYVFMAAAKVGGIYANDIYPVQFMYHNLMIQTIMLDAAYTSGIRNLLFLGSSCVYPKDCQQPIKEEYLLTGSLEETNSAYAVAKIAGIKMTYEGINNEYIRCY